MKRIIITISIILFLMTSCYYTNIDKSMLTIIDNGPTLFDSSVHIVTVNAPDGYGDIYYTTNGSSPTRKDKVYTATLQKGADNNSYYGVLVNEGSVISAVAYNNQGRTFVASMTVN